MYDRASVWGGVRQSRSDTMKYHWQAVVATHLVEEPLSDVWVGHLDLLHKVSRHQSCLTSECSSVVPTAVHGSMHSNHGTLMEVSVIALS